MLLKFEQKTLRYFLFLNPQMNMCSWYISIIVIQQFCMREVQSGYKYDYNPKFFDLWGNFSWTFLSAFITSQHLKWFKKEINIAVENFVQTTDLSEVYTCPTSIGALKNDVTTRKGVIFKCFLNDTICEFFLTVSHCIGKGVIFLSDYAGEGVKPGFLSGVIFFRPLSIIRITSRHPHECKICMFFSEEYRSKCYQYLYLQRSPLNFGGRNWKKFGYVTVYPMIISHLNSVIG